MKKKKFNSNVKKMIIQLAADLLTSSCPVRKLSSILGLASGCAKKKNNYQVVYDFLFKY